MTARNRGMPLKGAATERAAAVLDEFRAGGGFHWKNRKAISKATAAALLDMAARNRGMLLKGAATERAAAVLDEFRAGADFAGKTGKRR